MADFWTFDDANGDLTSITSGFTAIQINSKGKILSGGKDLSTIFLGASSGGGNTAVDTLVITTSANWNTAYNTSTAYIANSATWVTYTALNTVSGNWQNTSTTVNSNSANWNTAYNTSTAYVGISSTYATTSFVQTNFLQLTGGTLTGSLSSNSSITTTSNVSASQATVISLQLYDTGLGRYITLTSNNGILTVT